MQSDIKKDINAARVVVDPLPIEVDDEHRQRDFVRKKPTLSITIDGHTITCMNYTKKTVVESNKDAAVFFQTGARAACDRTIASAAPPWQHYLAYRHGRSVSTCCKKVSKSHRALQAARHVVVRRLCALFEI